MFNKIPLLMLCHVAPVSSLPLRKAMVVSDISALWMWCLRFKVMRMMPISTVRYLVYFHLLAVLLSVLPLTLLLQES